MTKHYLAAAVIAAFLLTFFSLPQASANDLKIGASVIKVEGDGQAKVRRKNGMEVRAGVPLSVFPGDKITTDDKSLVELLLPDGSIIKVGLNSEYKIESAEEKTGFIAWVTNLTKGRIRALVEKTGDKKNVRFRVNTPAGTMGVRGTEFLLEHDPVTNTTRLFTFHGRVEFGPASCKTGTNCQMVTDRMMSEIKAGDKSATNPRAFTAEELLRAQEAGNAALDAAAKAMASARALDQAVERLALLQGLKEAKAKSGQLVKLNEADLEKIVKEAEQKLQRAQDLFMERNESMRKAMHAAKEAGTFEAQLEFADKFNKLAGGRPNGSLRENTGARQTSRFALARSLTREDDSSAPAASGRLSPNSRLRDLLRLNRLQTAADFEEARRRLTSAQSSVLAQQEEVRLTTQRLQLMQAVAEEVHPTSSHSHPHNSSNTQSSPYTLSPTRDPCVTPIECLMEEAVMREANSSSGSGSATTSVAIYSSAYEEEDYSSFANLLTTLSTSLIANLTSNSGSGSYSSNSGSGSGTRTNTSTGTSTTYQPCDLSTGRICPTATSTSTRSGSGSGTRVRSNRLR